MQGVLPLSLSLSDDSARIVGAYVRLGLVDVVRPPLDSIDAALQSMHRTLRQMTQSIVDSVGTVQSARLRVQVMNEDLLDHIEATRWAVAYFSYNTFLELLDLVHAMHWLQGRSHIHLHDIIAALHSIDGGLAAIGAEMTFIGSAVVGLLQAILDQLRRGIRVWGQIDVSISTGGLGDFLKTLDLWKLLGLLGILALGLGLIVLFLVGVALALRLFGAGALKAALAIGALVLALVPLMSKLAGYDWDTLARIGVGFAGIAAFVALLGLAFRLVTSDLSKIVPELAKFFTAIGKLMDTLAKFQWDALARIGAAFAGIAVFVALLGLAFRLVTSDLTKIVPPLDTFFTSITRLMTALAGFQWGQLARIGAAFAGIAGFVALLGLAFRTVTSDLTKIVPQLDAFFTSISRLMTGLAGFGWGQLARIGAAFAGIALFVWGLGQAFGTFTDNALKAIPVLLNFLDGIGRLMSTFAGYDWEQLGKIAVAFLLIGLFVWGLSAALNTLTADTVAAIPALVQLLGALTALAGLMARMSVGELITMGVGLALVAAFVWAIAAALVYARGPLLILAGILTTVAGILDTVTSAAGRLWGVLSQVGGFFGRVFSGIGNLFSSAAPALAMPTAPAAVAMVPPPAPELPAAAAQSLSLLGPGGGLGPAAGGGEGGALDQSVNVNGGISVSVTADRLEADSASLLSDDIIAQLSERLGALRADQAFRTGARPAAG